MSASSSDRRGTPGADHSRLSSIIRWRSGVVLSSVMKTSCPMKGEDPDRQTKMPTAKCTAFRSVPNASREHHCRGAASSLGSTQPPGRVDHPAPAPRAATRGRGSSPGRVRLMSAKRSMRPSRTFADEGSRGQSGGTHARVPGSWPSVMRSIRRRLDNGSNPFPNLNSFLNPLISLDRNPCPIV